MLQWDKAFCYDGSGNPTIDCVTTYRVYYGYESGDYHSWVDTCIPPDCISPSTQHEVTGLALDQVYYFAVTAWKGTTCGDPPGPCESGFSNEISWINGVVTVEPPTDGEITWLWVDPPTAIYFQDFESYDAGESPSGWIDTGANNSMVENDLFSVFDLSGNKAFGTSSHWTNIHSHYGISGLNGYEYSGKMMINDSFAGIGITFFSDYPNADKYYRLKRDPSTSFFIGPHGTSVVGDIETGLTPLPDTWYNFKVNVESTGLQTNIRAKVWESGLGEPSDWQIDCFDDSANRFVDGSVGVWSMGNGSKFWDDLKVRFGGTE
jgi:hypothetical protein